MVKLAYNTTTVVKSGCICRVFSSFSITGIEREKKEVEGEESCELYFKLRGSS